MNGPEDENAPAMVVAPGFNVGIREKEDGKNDNDNIPSREDQAVHNQTDKEAELVEALEECQPDGLT